MREAGQWAIVAYVICSATKQMLLVWLTFGEHVHGKFGQSQVGQNTPAG